MGVQSPGRARTDHSSPMSMAGARGQAHGRGRPASLPPGQEGSGAGRGSEGRLGPPPWSGTSRPASPHTTVPSSWAAAAPPLRLDSLSPPQCQPRGGQAALRSLRPALGSLRLGGDMGTVQPRHSAGGSHLPLGPAWPHLHPTPPVAPQPVGEGEGQAPHQALPDPHPGLAPPSHAFWGPERPSSGKFSPSPSVNSWDSGAPASTRLQAPRATMSPGCRQK